MKSRPDARNEACKLRLTLAVMALTLFAGTSQMQAAQYWWGNGVSAYGGSGTWDTSSSLWTASYPTPGAWTPWPNGGADEAIFTNTAGTVTLGAQAINVARMSFMTNAWTITGGTLNFASGGIISVTNDSQPTISSAIMGAGTLTLTGGKGTWPNVKRGILLYGNNSNFTGKMVATQTANYFGLSITNDFNLGAEPSSYTADALTLSGGVALQNQPVSSTVNIAANRGITISGNPYIYNGNNTAVINLNSKITGSSALNFRGGTIGLNSTNNYTGNTILDVVKLQIGVDNAVPHGAGFGNLLFADFDGASTVDLNGHLLTLNGVDNTAIKAASAIDNKAAGTAATLVIGDNNTSGPKSIGVTIQNTGSGASLSLVKIGTGTQTLSGVNTYSGGTTISNGVLLLGTNGALPAAGAVSVLGGTLNLSNYNQNVSSVVLSNNASIIGSGGILTGSAFALSSGTNKVVLAGAASLTKDTSGTVVLYSNNTYTGFTTISGGTLALNGAGAITTSSAISVLSPARLDVTQRTDGTLALVGSSTLSGDGTIDGSVNAGGSTVITPGNPTGALTITTNCTLGGTLNMQIDGSGVATNYLHVGGALNLVAGPGLTLNLTVNGVLGAGPYLIADYGSYNGTPFSAVNGLPTGYEIDYNYGAAGEIAIVKATVTTPPAISSVVGPAVGECHSNATFVAVISGSSPQIRWLTNNVLVAGQTLPSMTLTGLSLGTYSISVIATNSAGTASNGVTMVVLDTTAPVVSLNGSNPMWLQQGGTFVDPGATATDGCAGSVPVTVSGTVDTNVIGNYTLTYSANDGNGNSNSITRTVNVVSSTESVWQTPDSGNWSDTANWVAGMVPSASDITADFSLIDPANDITVHVDSYYYVGSLKFGDPNTNSAAGVTVDNGGYAGNQLELASSNGVSLVTVNDLAPGKRVTIAATLAGSNQLTKDGAGTLELSAVNTYSGGTVISNGWLQVAKSTSLGSGALTLAGGGLYTTAAISIGSVSAAGTNQTLLTSGENVNVTNISGGGMLNLSDQSRAWQKGFTLVGDSSGYSGKLNVSNSWLVLSSDTSLGAVPAAYTPDALTLQGFSVLANTAGNHLTCATNRGMTLNATNGENPVLFNYSSASVWDLNGPINGVLSLGSARLTLRNGSFNLNATNNYTGFTELWSAKITVGVDNPLARGAGKGGLRFADWDAGVNSVLDLNGHTLTLGSLWSQSSTMTGGVIDNSAAGPATLVIGEGNATTNLDNQSFAGIITNTGGPLSLVKIGSGTQVLSGNNKSYSGMTTVSNGTLLVNGNSVLLTNLFAVKSGAALGGSGTINANVNLESGAFATNILGSPLTLSKALNLQGNTMNVFIPGTNQLAMGDYLLFTNTAYGISGAFAAVNVSGAGVGGAASILTSSSAVVLHVDAAPNFSTNAYLTSLVLSPPGTLTPGFASNVFVYTASEAYGSTPRVTVINADTTATNRLIFNGLQQGVLVSGVPSAGLPLTLGVTNQVQVLVTAQDGVTTRLYTVNVVEQPNQATQPKLNSGVSGNSLTLSWDADRLGYRLLMQTNNLNKGVSTNLADWATVAGSASITSTNIPIQKTILNEYYRLVYP